MQPLAVRVENTRVVGVRADVGQAAASAIPAAELLRQVEKVAHGQDPRTYSTLNLFDVMTSFAQEHLPPAQPESTVDASAEPPGKRRRIEKIAEKPG